MPRDPALDAAMRADIAALDPAVVLDGRPMFGGLGFLRGGHLTAAARAGRAMYRVGPAGEAAALALPGVTRMLRGDVAMPGYVWLDRPHLDDPDTRAALTRLALSATATLPPKGAPC